jgi:RHH-type proline utilization regulon transcriptional repressor/proline dehydrogenase/delta 1-pyrroline-5-carboxylate dehydrogenase
MDHPRRDGAADGALTAPFANEPVLELRRAAVRDRLGPALAALDATLPLEVPVLIDGREGPGAGEELLSTDPGAPDQLVARARCAGPDDVQRAIAVARGAQPAWGRTPAAERAAVLGRAAAWMRERRLELAALQVRECAKPWPEADGDVCEAIDYLEYYARGAVALAHPPELAQAPGERNVLRETPRGVVAVIAPWNFPLAIPTGMTAAALATGNAAVLKPAEQSPGSALMLVRSLLAAGLPPGALALLPGEGDVGAALVRHPDVQAIAFTGSLAVGLGIVRAAGETVPGQRHLKRVIAELGGKNCVIVDADADLDQAVPAIVGSAFGYAGQKCSAAARVLVHQAVADVLERRVAGAVRELVVGQASDLLTQVPPLIEREAQQRVERYIAEAGEQGRIVARAQPAPTPGWFVSPAVVAGLPPDAAVLREEVFGPLLTIEAVRDVDHALALVDELPAALTGGLFSRDPATVAYVTARMPVGNLYVNRAITGAMVSRQPFGGSRLSGTGAKAGGPDYLRQFTEQRVVCENTVRHGLVV